METVVFCFQKLDIFFSLMFQEISGLEVIRQKFNFFKFLIKEKIEAVFIAF
jgi:hypothetical protein